MSELSSVLKTLMHEVGITVTELARQTGVGQPVIHRMASGETDNPKVGSLSPIAKFFNVNISHLIGDDPLPEGRINGSHNPHYRHWSKLPLLTMEQATMWPHQQIFDTEISSYISTESKVSNQAFAVRVEDNTMEPRFPVGTVLIIDPAIKPCNGEFALIHIDGHRKAQFKQVQFDGDDLYLKPLNEDFQTNHISQDYRFCGVMVQAVTEFLQDNIASRETPQFLQRPPVKKRRSTDAITDEAEA